MIHFTADTHFGHSNIIKYCNRPFSNIEEHDQCLIDNWNRVVGKKDTVYHLGDFIFSREHIANHLLSQLQGQIILIKGNHDPGHLFRSPRFQAVKDVHIVRHQRQKIFLSHYAHRTWQFINQGAWHLFGHSHGNLPSHGKSFDVGVDCWDYTPVSFDQVKEKMENLELDFDYERNS